MKEKPERTMTEQESIQSSVTRDGNQTGESILALNGVTKRFGALTAVNEVSVSVGEEEFLGLIGPNGAGKTTLFNLISGFLKPDQGRILLQGTNIEDDPASHIARKGLSRTFQEVKPFPEMTGLENVMVGSFMRTGSRSEAESAAREILRRFDLSYLVDRSPKQFTLAEKKQIDLARTIATDPQIVLVDEIFAGLNPGEQEEMMATLKDIHRDGVTIILIEHVMEVIMSLADRIVVMNNGEIIADDQPEVVANDDRVVEAYLGKGWEEKNA